jgi:hypothetical protein
MRTGSCCCDSFCGRQIRWPGRCSRGVTAIMHQRHTHGLSVGFRGGGVGGYMRGAACICVPPAVVLCVCSTHTWRHATSVRRGPLCASRANTRATCCGAVRPPSSQSCTRLNRTSAVSVPAVRFQRLAAARQLSLRVRTGTGARPPHNTQCWAAGHTGCAAVCAGNLH